MIQTYDEPAKNQVLIRLAHASASEADLDAPAQARAAGARPRTTRENPVVESSTEIVGPIVGAELRRKADPAHRASACSSSSSTSASASRARSGARRPPSPCSTTCSSPSAFLAFFRYEITLNVIAALLTLVGYSVNDTIVIFDRARENLRQRPQGPLRKILNDSVNQTLTRTLISNGTTFLAVLGLYLFGGEVLRGFGFTMVVGILVGTYSTIYIASPHRDLVADGYRKKQRPPAARAAL